MSDTLPNSAKKLFWGDNLDELSWKKHKTYITQTVLEKGDTQAIAWLFKQQPKNDLVKELPKLKLSDKSRTFWTIYLS
jgi:hypothetical protein